MRRRVATLAACASLLVSVLSSASAARPTPVLPEAIPEVERERVNAIADAAHVATRVEAEPFAIRRQVFEYLLDHPAFATHVTRALRIGRYRIERTADGLFLDDGWGVTGNFWVVYAGNGARVMRARGEYRKMLMPTIEGEAVTMIEYTLTPLPDGRSLVRSTVTGFVRLDNRLAVLAVKIASSAAQRKADKEARRLMKVFAKVSRRLDEDPAGVVELLRKQPDMPRRELEEFVRLLSAR
jgi:hypothetical protein